MPTIGKNADRICCKIWYHSLHQKISILSSWWVRLEKLRPQKWSIKFLWTAHEEYTTSSLRKSFRTFFEAHNIIWACVSWGSFSDGQPKRYVPKLWLLSRFLRKSHSWRKRLEFVVKEESNGELSHFWCRSELKLLF